MCKTIKQKVKFKTTPDLVYQYLADAQFHARVTGQSAVISGNVGGAFSTQGGRVTGVNVDLVPGKRIVLAWRRKDFPEGIFSMATLQLAKAKNGGTELTLTHRGVPKQLIPGVEQDWRKMYWERIRELEKKNVES